MPDQSGRPFGKPMFVIGLLEFDMAYNPILAYL
jgi:hypothetical protein